MAQVAFVIHHRDSKWTFEAGIMSGLSISSGKRGMRWMELSWQGGLCASQSGSREKASYIRWDKKFHFRNLFINLLIAICCGICADRVQSGLCLPGRVQVQLSNNWQAASVPGSTFLRFLDSATFKITDGSGSVQCSTFTGVFLDPCRPLGWGAYCIYSQNGLHCWYSINSCYVSM